MFRKEQQHDPNNNRGIALVDVLSKICISIITKRLTFYVEAADLLPVNKR